MTTPYQMAINNIASYLGNTKPKFSDDVMDKREVGAFDVFEASSVLSVVFCKAKEEIAMDIIKVKLD